MKDADSQIIELLRLIKAAAGGSGSVSWGQILGTITDQTDLVAYVAANAGPGYKVYAALLTQSGTDAPVATVLQNTLGGTVVWSYGVTGAYVGTLAGAFPANKTVGNNGFIDPGDVPVFKLTRVNDDDVDVRTYNAAGQDYTDGLLNNTFIEIRVYP